MLKELLLKLKENKGPLSLTKLSEELNISVPLLEQMLRTLVANGKLKKVTPEFLDTCTSCDNCPIANGCDLSDIFQENQFKITH